MLGRIVGSVNAGHRLSAAATLAPPRAASLRAMLARLGDTASLAELDERRASWLREPPPRDDASAWRALVAEDLGDVLERAATRDGALDSWEDPLGALADAAAGMQQSLGALGVELAAPRLTLCQELPAAYAHPSLWMVSVDAADAAATGVAPGVLLLERALAPLWSELALAHVLVHVALGQRTPEALGRGFEEGLCEVLGGLHAGGEACGSGRIDAAFRALRLTPSLNPHRQALLGWTRAAATFCRGEGMRALARLVQDGRGAVKAVERELGLVGATGAEAFTAPRVAAPGPEVLLLERRLDALLAAGPPPLAVGALAFYLTRALRAGGSVEQAARALGVPVDAAQDAARELHHGAFVALLDEHGRVLVDDLDLVLRSRTLRYATPRDPA